MKTVRISEDTHSKLVAYAAYLTLEQKKQKSLNDAIEHLLDEASSTRYKKEWKEIS